MRLFLSSVQSHWSKVTESGDALCKAPLVPRKLSCRLRLPEVGSSQCLQLSSGQDSIFNVNLLLLTFIPLHLSPCLPGRRDFSVLRSPEAVLQPSWLLCTATHPTPGVAHLPPHPFHTLDSHSWMYLGSLLNCHC